VKHKAIESDESAADAVDAAERILAAVRDAF